MQSGPRFKKMGRQSLRCDQQPASVLRGTEPELGWTPVSRTLAFWLLSLSDEIVGIHSNEHLPDGSAWRCLYGTLQIISPDSFQAATSSCLQGEAKDKFCSTAAKS